MPDPLRGEVWVADLNPTRDHEQAGRRPVLVVSVDEFNRGSAGLVAILPMTSTIRPIPLHVIVQPPEGGLKVQSRVLCDAIRSISKGRLLEHWGNSLPRDDAGSGRATPGSARVVI